MRHEAPGLPADWLNGWLAAIGVTVLIPGARLRWTGALPARLEQRVARVHPEADLHAVLSAGEPAR